MTFQLSPEPLSFSEEQLRDPEFSLRREWLVTNGIGGFASGTIAGANTRRYHGLLIASLVPPVERTLFLAKLDETLQVTDSAGKVTAYPLFSNVWDSDTDTEGLRTLSSFALKANLHPTWAWTPAPGIRLEKMIFMVPGQNTTFVVYTVNEAPADVIVKLRLTPLFAWTDYHHEMQEVGDPPCKWDGKKLTVTPNGVQNGKDGLRPITLRAERNNTRLPLQIGFRFAPEWYRNYLHSREAERGQDCHASLFTPGELTVTLPIDDAIEFGVSCEQRAGTSYSDIFETTFQKRPDLIRARSQQFDEVGKRLAIAADAFRVSGADGRKTIIAGYHWFTDWGRDTMISLPGLCLTTGYPEFAREVLLSFAENLKNGLIPNRFTDAGTPPEYNTADATLWFVNALYRYVEATDDWAILDTGLWEKLQRIVSQHEAGTLHGIKLDLEDGLLFAGEAGIQVTWMDAKVGDWVVTPRIGKPVEICALWINALEILLRFADKRGETLLSRRYSVLCERAKSSFLTRFPRPDGQGLYDVLDTPDYHAPDTAIRPNQVFALSLPFAPISPKSPLASFILHTIERELATPYGLRSLSPSCPGYQGQYRGDTLSRDGAYHQGTVWGWLQGSYAEAHFKVYGDKEASCELLRPLTESLGDFGVGFLPEIYDGDAPHHPNGCIAQAWSVAETLRVWVLLS